MKRLAISLLSALLLLPLAAPQSAPIACSATSRCPESSPCCSAEGTCGGGALQCAGGCQPYKSFQASSCLPNPICQDQDLTLTPKDFNNRKIFTPILEYDGLAASPFTLDSGTIGPGPVGINLQLTIARQSKISTTRYMLYGNVSASLRHTARTGLVATMITMSDIKDEVDWEFTSDDESQVLTNFYGRGRLETANGTTLYPKGGFRRDEWHDYGLQWTEQVLRWTIDGATVREVWREDAPSSFPSSPSRVQFSVWAGGNSTNPEGTIEWSGGPINWTTPEYESDGFYSQEMRSFSMSCDPAGNGDPTSANTTSTGSSGTGGSQNDMGAASAAGDRPTNASGTDAPPTSWVYTDNGVSSSAASSASAASDDGNSTASAAQPEFVLSNDPIPPLADPSRDGIAGLPGYRDTSSPGTEGKEAQMWDGTGENSLPSKHDKDQDDNKDNHPDKAKDDDQNDKNEDDKEKSSSDDADGGSTALKYGAPIAGAFLALLAVWGLLTLIYRRRRSRSLQASGVTGIGGGPGMYHSTPHAPLLSVVGGGIGGGGRESRGRAGASGNGSVSGLYAVASTPAALGRKSSRYVALQDAAEAGLPAGTQRRGTGIAPAPGPRPSGNLFEPDRRRWVVQEEEEGAETQGNWSEVGWESRSSLEDGEKRLTYAHAQPVPHLYSQRHPQPQQRRAHAVAAPAPPTRPQEPQHGQVQGRDNWPNRPLPYPAHQGAIPYHQQQQPYATNAYTVPSAYRSPAPHQVRHYDTPNMAYYTTPQLDHRAQYHRERPF